MYITTRANEYKLHTCHSKNHESHYRIIDTDLILSELPNSEFHGKGTLST